MLGYVGLYQFTSEEGGGVKGMLGKAYENQQKFSGGGCCGYLVVEKVIIVSVHVLQVGLRLFYVCLRRTGQVIRYIRLR